MITCNLLLVGLFTLSVHSFVVGTENQFVVKKERRANRRSLRQHCGEHCAQILRRGPAIQRALAQLERTLCSRKGYEKLFLLCTHLHELMADIQELMQQALEDYIYQEKCGLWQCSSRDHLATLNERLQILDNELVECTQLLHNLHSSFKSVQGSVAHAKASFEKLKLVENKLKKSLTTLKG